MVDESLVLAAVQAGTRPQLPQRRHHDSYQYINIIEACWSASPEDRWALAIPRHCEVPDSREETPGLSEARTHWSGCSTSLNNYDDVITPCDLTLAAVCDVIMRVDLVLAACSAWLLSHSMRMMTWQLTCCLQSGSSIRVFNPGTRTGPRVS